MESIDQILSRSTDHLRASIAYLTRDAHGDIHGHTARPQIFDTHWLSEEGDGHYLGAYWGSASGWEDGLICLDSVSDPSTIPWEKKDYKHYKDAQMDFKELIARCNPTDQGSIQYITMDASGALFGHVMRPYTFEGHWRSPDGDGIYLGMAAERPQKWEESIVARPAKLGAFEAPVWAVGAAVVIVAIVWGYMTFMRDAKLADKPAHLPTTRTSAIAPADGVVPASAEVPPPANDS